MSLKKTGPQLGVFVKKKVSIFLGSGIIVSGILIGFDQFMNLIIEKGTALIFGRTEILGTTIVRGGEIFVIELSET